MAPHPQARGATRASGSSNGIGKRPAPFKPPGPARSSGHRTGSEPSSASGKAKNTAHANTSGGVDDDDEFGTALDLEGADIQMLDEEPPRHVEPAKHPPPPSPRTAIGRPGASTAAAASSTKAQSSSRAKGKAAAAAPRPRPAARSKATVDLSDLDDDVEISLAAGRDKSETAATTTTTIPGVPASLLTRIVHEHLQDKTVGVSRPADALLRRYVDVFVREAVARAAEGHSKGGEDGAGVGPPGACDDVWLDVEDLERITPGMILDF